MQTASVLSACDGPVVALGKRADDIGPAPAPAQPAPHRIDDAAHVVLDEHAFRQELARERRRVERTQAPLSMLIYRIDAEGGEREPCAARLLHILRRIARRTDVVGRLADAEVAVLLPDTREAGALRLLDKTLDEVAELPVSAATVSYPHCVFDQVGKGGHAEAPFTRDWPLQADRTARAPYLGKRMFDVLGALAALLLLSPLMLLTAAAVAATSRGPVIFRQVRLGQGGRPFEFYKFRSMVADGDTGIHREFVTSLIKGRPVQAGEGGAPVYKLRGDPRVTPVGRLIRKASIDELPQLFNVLRGDMSLVGPRPPLPYEAEHYSAWHLHRVLDMKPGITGLWQVDGRSRVPFDEMVRMDLRYSRQCSLRLDLRILLKTIVVVLRCDGAG
ncbi:sugar transferase [Aquincola sp. MAHUQ-54]|uniref:Sugar transferase n=1 Tax=Aquincola agrisoli TaxID=3119538 RepID=A0AAW9QIN5_9BURK